MPTPEALMQSAQAAALAVVSPAVAASARSALEAVSARTESTLLREAVADVAAIGRAADWGAVLDDVAKSSATTIQTHGADAMRWGYEARMQDEAGKFGLDFEWGDEDAQTLAAYPVQGHVIADHASQRAQSLRFDLAGAINSAAAMTTDAKGIADSVQTIALAFADGVAQLVDECWHSGQTAAILAIGAAVAEQTGSAGA